MPGIDLWFSCGSTYTYLAVMSLSDAEARHGVRFRLRPFNLGVLFNEMGRWPFPEGLPKTRYMWRDIERRAMTMGLPARLPAPYPAPNTPLANRVAYVALQHRWGRDYLRASYSAWFERGLMPGEPDNVSESLAAVGQNVEAVMSEVERSGAGEALSRETDQARELGIFGAPTFAVGEELFWGHDRLDDAVAWLKASSG